ncbi:hypothetical protein QPJ96_21990 (plasmid) [Pantoea agglomerans]|nr:hypothetical protein [Pantoea agglomerans]WIL44484.1 hypothetical protein QPJ96_21990 [Pantoea agglomerans]
MIFRLFSALPGHVVSGLDWIRNGILHNSAWGAAQLSVGLEAYLDGKCINKLWETHQVENLFTHMLISAGSGVAIFFPDANMGNYFFTHKGFG